MSEPPAPPKTKNPLEPSRAPKPLPAARSRAALGLAAAASEGAFRLQVCEDCGAAQYPPRDVCVQCLSGALRWRDVDPHGVVSAVTATQVSNENYFRERPAWRTGLVALDGGVNIVAHLSGGCAAGARVRLDLKLDPSGRGAVFATPDIAPPDAQDDRQLAAFTADPRFRNILITAGRASTALPLAKALREAGAARIFVGVSELWRPHAAIANAEALEIVALDPTDANSAQELAGLIGDKVDILINNADYFRPAGMLAGQNASHARCAFELHCLGMMRLAAAFGPVMRARTAERGRSAAAFVNLISAWALSGSTEYAAYAASQAALRSLSLALRAESRASGLKIVDVLSGPIDDEWRQSLRPPKVAPATLAAAVVAGLREGREEIVVGEIAREIHAKWAADPRVLRQEAP